MKHYSLIAFVAALLILAFSSIGIADDALEALQPNQQIADFSAINVYENDAGTAIGARFRHNPSGMILDFLRIQSVPQAYTWVNSFPTSDMGEPHTCEHLLLGKGNKGRYISSLEDMCLGSSSAGTYRLHTDYHYHTVASGDVFYDLFEAKLQAFIHPDFTDEEIRREVCNVGVVVDPDDGSLSLEEKGTVYTEMVSSFERPSTRMYTKMLQVMYGDGHPCSYVSGGTPEALRQQTPADLWRFHKGTYTLSNMNMIVCMPSEYELHDLMQRISDICARVEPDVKPGDNPAIAEDHLPEPNPYTQGTAVDISFPHQNENEPGILVFGWPATLKTENYDRLMLDLFLQNFASGQTSNLYKKLIDSQSRLIDIGSPAIYGSRAFDFGNPVYVWINSIPKASLEKPIVDSIRAIILNEIQRIASFEDGSEELKAFNERAINRLVASRREARTFLSSPPRFGYRSISNEWSEHFKRIRIVDSFRKDLTMQGVSESLEEMLKSETNIWRDYISDWGLLSFEPYSIVATADPSLLQADAEAKQKRLEDFAESLKSRYGVESKDEAIRRYAEEYDKNTEEINEAVKGAEIPEFVDSPPMTLDDQLDYRVENLPGGGPLVVSTFETMTGATVGLSLDMHVVPEDMLMYISALPTLMSDVGVIKDGVPIPYDDMQEAIRKEIRSVGAFYSTSYSQDRVELVVEASGTNADETEKAMQWANLILFSPDWRVENLPRIRDAVDQSLNQLRGVMKGREEYWVSTPSAAYWRQDRPLLLAADCFLTSSSFVERLRWRLRECSSEDVFNEFQAFLDPLSTAPTTNNREQLQLLLTSLESNDENAELTESGTGLIARYNKLNDEAKEFANEAAHDLLAVLAEVPDQTLAQDWAQVCAWISDGLKMEPSQVLDDLNKLRKVLLKQDNAKSYVIASSSLQHSVIPKLKDMVARFSTEPSSHVKYSSEPLVKHRLAERDPEAVNAVYAGLVNESTQNGVFVNSAKCTGYKECDKESLMRFLSSKLYGGGGSHGIFMKTWGAGLAYSNGVGSGGASGRISYYAERCPDLAQTMQFVVNELKNAPPDESLLDYAIAQVFSSSRAGSSYESRGRSIAWDLADGISPEDVKNFRTSILNLLETPDIYDKLHSKMLSTYGRVLPGIDPTGPDSEDANFFIIGPEKQFKSFEEYLKTCEGPTKVHRVYPRDFWIVSL